MSDASSRIPCDESYRARASGRALGSSIGVEHWVERPVRIERPFENVAWDGRKVRGRCLKEKLGNRESANQNLQIQTPRQRLPPLCSSGLARSARLHLRAVLDASDVYRWPAHASMQLRHQRLHDELHNPAIIERIFVVGPNTSASWNKANWRRARTRRAGGELELGELELVA